MKMPKERLQPAAVNIAGAGTYLGVSADTIRRLVQSFDIVAHADHGVPPPILEVLL